jgi:hypothetical protein
MGKTFLKNIFLSHIIIIIVFVKENKLKKHGLFVVDLLCILLHFTIYVTIHSHFFISKSSEFLLFYIFVIKLRFSSFSSLQIMFALFYVL